MNWMQLVFVFILMHDLTSSMDDVVTMDGDVMLGGLFVIQEGDDCERINPLSVQVHQAVRWTILQLQAKDFTPNFTIGLKSYKTCGKSEQAVKHATELLNTVDTRDEIYGILGPEKSSEMQAVSRFLSSLDRKESLIQMGFSTTSASLSDTSIFSNLYRLIESDAVQVKVIVHLLKQLKWNYVAIGYENDLYGISGANALKEAAEAEGICIPIFQEIGNISTIIRLREELDVGQQSPVSGMVFIGLGNTLTSILEYFDRHLKMENFQLIASEALALEQMFLKDNANTLHDRAKGLLVPTPVYSPIDHFTLYWNELFQNESAFREEVALNPWIGAYFESLTGCDLTPSTDIAECWAKSPLKYTMEQQPLFVSYAVLATSILIQALKNVHETVCPGTRGSCEALRANGTVAMFDEMKTLNITPSAYLDGLFPMISSASFENGKMKGWEGEMYELYNFRMGDDRNFRFLKAGYFDGLFRFTGKYTIRSYSKSGEVVFAVRGQCKDGFDCSECLADPANQLVHIPGDVYVVGLAPIHNRYPVDDDPFSYFKYGSLRQSISVDIAEALIYAIDKVNKNKLLGNNKIGLILFDTSNNPLIVKDRVISLHKGQLKLGKDFYSSEIVTRIIGYVGPVASSISIPLSPTMKNLNQLFIAFGATSSKLSDREEHPTFMRTTTALDKQVEPMMKVAQELGADYIQVLFTDEAYGQSGKEAVLEGAKKSGICVAQSLPVNEGVGEESYVGVVNELRRFTNARLVVVFARSHIAPALLSAISKELDHLGEFIFFGSGEGWAQRLHTISGKLNLRGSFTMAQTLPNDPDFVSYYKSLSGTSDTNPWIREYLEKRGNCFYPGSFQRTSTVQCVDDQLSAVYETDTWVPFAANALTALVIGFNKSMTGVCKGSITKCEMPTTDTLIQHVKEVKLDLFRDGILRRVFDSDGNGASGFRISQIVLNQSTGHLVYRDIGSSIGDKFVFDKSLLSSDVNYASRCPTDYECSKCDIDSSTPSASCSTTPLVAVVGVEAVIILVLIVVVVVIVVRSRKRNKQESDKYQRPYHCTCQQDGEHSSGYLHAVYHTPCDSQEPDGAPNNGCQPTGGISLVNSTDGPIVQ